MIARNINDGVMQKRILMMCSNISDMLVEEPVKLARVRQFLFSIHRLIVRSFIIILGYEILKSYLFLLSIDLWPIEARDKYCPNAVRNIEATSQISCQSLCEGRTKCIGISYNPNENDCYLCNDGSLRPSIKELAFYKRPSN